MSIVGTGRPASLRCPSGLRTARHALCRSLFYIPLSQKAETMCSLFFFFHVGSLPHECLLAPDWLLPCTFVFRSWWTLATTLPRPPPAPSPFYLFLAARRGPCLREILFLGGETASAEEVASCCLLRLLTCYTTPSPRSLYSTQTQRRPSNTHDGPRQNAFTLGSP